MTFKRLFLIIGTFSIIALLIGYWFLFQNNLVLVIDNYSWINADVDVEVWVDNDLVVNHEVSKDRTGHKPEVFPIMVDSDKLHRLRVSLAKQGVDEIEFTVDKKTYLIIQIRSDSLNVYQSEFSVINFEEALRKGFIFNW